MAIKPGKNNESMGCNYYAYPKATQELKEKIINHINHNDFHTAKSLMPDKIHVGKSSYGWKFLFNHNEWRYFAKSIESLEIFLLACDIVDEYYRPISNIDFWQMVKNKEGGLDNKECFLSHPNENHSDNFNQEYHFGLFFSDCTEFS